MSYIALANTTLTNTASSVTFSNIPASVNGTALRDLVMVLQGAASGSTGSQSGVGIRFNGDSGSNYSYVAMAGGGSNSTFSGSQTNNMFLTTWAYAFVSPTRNNLVTQIMDYSSTDKHKTGLNRATLPDGAALTHAGRWANTAAITSLSVVVFTGQPLAIGTTISLYGIAG